MLLILLVALLPLYGIAGSRAAMATPPHAATAGPVSHAMQADTSLTHEHDAAASDCCQEDGRSPACSSGHGCLACQAAMAGQRPSAANSRAPAAAPREALHRYTSALTAPAIRPPIA